MVDQRFDLFSETCIKIVKLIINHLSEANRFFRSTCGCPGIEIPGYYIASSLQDATNEKWYDAVYAPAIAAGMPGNEAVCFEEMLKTQTIILFSF